MAHPLNRRRFLKYAGATAAVAGASAIGLDYLVKSPRIPIQQTKETLMSTSSILSATSLSATSTSSAQLASLQGKLFFDYNGNGRQDGEEPAVAGALVQLKDNAGKVIVETLADSAGDYKLEDVKPGSYGMHIGVDQFSDKRLRYMCRSPNDFARISDGYAITLSEGKTDLNVGLMEGFLTLPFGKGTKFSRSSAFGMTGMFDVDRRVGFVRSYDPAHVKQASESGGQPPWVVDQHDGIDYCFPDGTDVVATAPGIVKEIGYDATGSGNYVVIYHQADGSQTLYAHNSVILVTVQSQVTRNQLIAKSGSSGNAGEPHLHFRYATWTTPPNPIDPYRDLSNPSSLSYWTRDNSPQYP